MGNLQDFNDYLESEVNRAIYVIGAQGQDASEEFIKKKETGINRTNAINLWKKRVKEGVDPIHCYDCSGLGMYYIQNVKKWTKDMTANGMMGKCEMISENNLTTGCWVFKVRTSGSDKGKAYHIGYVVRMEDNKPVIISSKGRAYGVVYGETGWNRFGIPSFFKTEIKTEFVLTRVLKKGHKGDDVKYVQDLLVSLGYSLSSDGIFGKETYNVVKTYQKNNKLKVDGMVGSATAKSLGIKFRK